MNTATQHTRTLADYVHLTRFQDLPDEVVDYTKLLILDSLICGLSAGHLERSKMIHEVVKQLGGVGEATVFGLAGRFPVASAVMANAEIINCLDADDTFFTTSHFAAFNLAASLAEAQRCGASGKDMILAMALGFDVNARLSLASQVIKEAEDGSLQWSQVQGMGFAAYGTAASAASVRGLSREQMRNLFGLVNSFAPTPTVNTMSNRVQHPSMKYANYPATAQSGMLAVAFAEQGYIAEQHSLDGEGFLRAQGCLTTNHDLLVEDLGEKWWILESCIKYYPSCRYTHGPIDMLQGLMEKEQLSVEDIEKIEIRMNPMGYALRFFNDPPRGIAWDHRAPLNGAFNIPYVIALAAMGRTPGPDWYSEANLNNQEIWQLAARITTAEDQSARDEVKLALKEKIRRFRKTPASMTVWAKGREYLSECEYVNGDPWSPQTRATWDSVTRKFFNFCSGLVPESKILTIIDKVKHLDRLGNLQTDLAL